MDLLMTPASLIFFSALLMAGNIVGYAFLKRAIRRAFATSRKGLRVILVIYVVLLIFFLFGYLMIGSIFLHPGVRVDNWMISAVLFFGSIFVLMDIAIEIYLCRSLQAANLEIIKALVNAVEARDTNLRGHSIHVANLSTLIYSTLPLRLQRQTTLRDVQYAALLHDIGKLGISESVLDKPGSLTPEEWDEIRRHPVIGGNMIQALSSYRELAPYILYHHERLDGKGYLGISGDQIPLVSRIIAVADTYSAITMTRAYRVSKTHEQALAILRESVGTQLDGEISGAFLKLSEQEVEECRPWLRTGDEPSIAAIGTKRGKEHHVWH